MKRYIPVVFIIVAAILVFFLVGRNLFVKDNIMARAKTVIPIVNKDDTEQKSDESVYEEFTETSFIELANDETLLSIVTMDIDGDSYDDQINIVKTSNGPYLVLIVGLYNPASATYVRSSYVATNITQIKTFACTSLDVIGNHKNSLVYQGIADDGHSVLRIFNGSRDNNGEFVLSMIGDFDSDGSVFIQQSERNEAYELNQTTAEPFPVWVYSSAEKEDADSLDQLQTMYNWNETEGKYTEVKKIRIPGSRIAAKELSRIQDGTVATFANFLDGLWYKTDNTTGSLRYIFFDYSKHEIIFQFEDTEEVYSWLNSNLRRNGIYFSSVNQSVENLQRRFDVSLVNIDEIRVRIQDDVRMVISESSLWDGNYKKMTSKIVEKKEKTYSSECINSLIQGPAWTSSDGTYFVFKDGTFIAEGENLNDSGMYITNIISGTSVLQFRNNNETVYFSGYYIPSFNKVTKTKTDKRGRQTSSVIDDKDTILLQSIVVSPDGFFQTESRPIILHRAELKKTEEE